jgi:hypothetical protein
MAEPSEDEVLVKAKQLAHDDGRLWLWGSEELDNERDERGPFIYDSLRAEYLNRALDLLRHEKN